MYIDMDGVKRLKINLHAHTTDSDGRVSPEEAARIYREAGYDVLAITDHWRWHKSGELSGLRILAGAEYNVGGSDGAAGVYHILGLGCAHEPEIDREEQDPQRILESIPSGRLSSFLPYTLITMLPKDDLISPECSSSRI